MTLTDPALPETASFRWRREDTLRTAGLLAVIAALHVAAFGVLFALALLWEHLTRWEVIGGVLILSAVLVERSRRPPPEPPAD